MVYRIPNRKQKGYLVNTFGNLRRLLWPAAALHSVVQISLLAGG